MLSPAETALCAREPELPGLPLVLDAEALLDRAGLAGLRPVYLRYKPGTSCVAALVATDGSVTAFAAMTYPPARYREVRGRPKWQTGPEPVTYLDDVCTALVPLRHDRGVRAAQYLMDPARQADYLARLGLSGASLTLLRYKPGRRLVLRADGSAGTSAVLKCYTERDFVAALAGARHAEDCGGAALLAAEPGQRSIAMTWVKGRPLCPETGRPDLADFRRTGAELARLHAQRGLAPRRLDRATDVRELDEQARSLAWLLPELGTASRRISADLAARLSSLPLATRVLHGDFSADQVIIRDDGPVVIDWDRMAEGDPARDLGTFLARLDVQAIAGLVTPDDAATAGSALLDGYAGAGGLPASVVEQHARALFALATEGFRGRRSAWEARAEAILDRIEALLSNRPKRNQEHLTPGLSDALDPERMRPALAAALGAPEPLDLDVHLVRHKPGRRALVRYDAGFSDGTRSTVLGKLRAKGPDRRTPALHAALRSAGLDGRGPNRVGVPAPLGSIETPALWLQPFLAGRTLTEALASTDAGAGPRRAGTALAELHRTHVATSRTWTMQDELAVLEKALDRAAAALPALRVSIEAIGAAARERTGRLATVANVGIHRDFYPDQVLLGDEVTWLLDLDLYSQGDPAIDLGNFLAHLTELGLRLHHDPDHFAAHGRSFTAGYQSVGGSIDPERVDTLHWVSLARHIHLSLAVPGRAHITRALADLCSTALGSPPVQAVASCAR